MQEIADVDNNLPAYLDENPEIAWDSEIFSTLFTENASDQLTASNWNVEQLIRVFLTEESFLSDALSVAEEYDVEFSDVIRSVSRSLHAAVRARHPE